MSAQVLGWASQGLVSGWQGLGWAWQPVAVVIPTPARGSEGAGEGDHAESALVWWDLELGWDGQEAGAGHQG